MNDLFTILTTFIVAGTVLGFISQIFSGGGNH
jgi:hypothetical protein